MKIRKALLMEINIYWLALSRTKGLGNKTLLNISQRNKELGLTVTDFWNLSSTEMTAKYGLKERIARAVVSQRSNNRSTTELLRKLNEHEIKFLNLEDPDYPPKLRKASNPPFILYFLGNLDLLQRNPLAIVGSRDISLKGLEITYRFSEVLEKHGIVIIKGQTREVDSLAQLAAEKAKGSGVTVLSSGILDYLKKSDLTKGDTDLEKNLILSYVYPLLPWTPRTEMERNKIIFELSENIVIIEASDKGIIMKEGSKALKNGKKVYIVRYEDYPQNATGNKKLIEAGGIPISTSDNIDNLKDIINSVKGEAKPRVIISKEESRRQKKDLGQYFTPPSVVEFMYGMVGLMWGEKAPVGAKIVDPACGEGVFLKYALDNGISIGDNLYGSDIDERVKVKWDSLQIRNMMKLFIQDGLLDNKNSGIERGKFDLAIGNPPYGGTGLSELAQLLETKKMRKEPITLSLFEKNLEVREEVGLMEKQTDSLPLMEEKRISLIHLANHLGRSYELWKKEELIADYDEKEPEEEQTGELFPELKRISPGKKRVDLIVERIQKAKLLGKGKAQLHLTSKELKKLISVPIEVLFLERFFQLVRPGGYVAIIIPDGILANINLRYVQNWLFEKAQVMAIVSLPRETFKAIGTTAKTSIMFLKKPAEGEQIDLKNPVFMASVEYVGVNHKGKNDLPLVLKEFQKFIKGKKIKEKKMSPMITKAKQRELMNVHCARPEYWDRKYKILEKQMQKGGVKIVTIGDTEPYITYGAITPGKKMPKVKKGILYISQIHMKPTGLDFNEEKIFVPKNSDWDQDRFRVQYEDVLIARSGVASIGRTEIFRIKLPATVSCFVDIIRQNLVNPYYLALFMKSKFGIGQIERFRSGIGTDNINFKQIRSIKIPKLPDSIQQKIEKQYKNMSKWHDKAMGIKRELIDKGSSNKKVEKDPKYQRNIKKAEAMLKDLIRRTEEVIEGKREDI